MQGRDEYGVLSPDHPPPDHPNTRYPEPAEPCPASPRCSWSPPPACPAGVPPSPTRWPTASRSADCPPRCSAGRRPTSSRSRSPCCARKSRSLPAGQGGRAGGGRRQRPRPAATSSPPVRMPDVLNETAAIGYPVPVAGRRHHQPAAAPAAERQGADAAAGRGADPPGRSPGKARPRPSWSSRMRPRRVSVQLMQKRRYQVLVVREDTQPVSFGAGRPAGPRRDEEGGRVHRPPAGRRERRAARPERDRRPAGAGRQERGDHLPRAYDAANPQL